MPLTTAGPVLARDGSGVFPLTMNLVVEINRSTRRA